MTPAGERCTGAGGCGVRRELGLTRREAISQEFSLELAQARRTLRECTAATDPSSDQFTPAIAAWNTTSPLGRYLPETKA